MNRAKMQSFFLALSDKHLHIFDGKDKLHCHPALLRFCGLVKRN